MQILRKTWRCLAHFFRRLFNIPPSVVPQREVRTNRLNDAEYEQVFMQLLDGVHRGWSRGQVKGFLYAKHLNQADLVVWLKQFGERLQEVAQPSHPELAQRMVQLSQLDCGEVGEIAGEIGRELLSKSAESAPTPPPDNADIAEVYAWLSQGTEQLDLGDFQGAVTSYDQALRLKPDLHLAWYSRGLALAKLGRHEEAIATYDQAIHLQPDSHEAWYNRGIAAGKSLQHNPQTAALLQVQFPASPRVMLNPRLNQRGYEGELLSYEEGLRHCSQNTHPEGWGWLHQVMGDAHYFQGKRNSNYRKYWYQAVNEYHQALIALTVEAFPELRLKAVKNLIRVLLELEENTRTPAAH